MDSIGTVHRLTVDLEDYIATSDACLRGGTVRIDPCDNHSFRITFESELLCDLWSDRLKREAKLSCVGLLFGISVPAVRLAAGPISGQLEFVERCSQFLMLPSRRQ